MGTFAPALLLSFQRSLTTKAFSEPFIQIIDEEDDLHYGDEWTMRKIEEISASESKDEERDDL